MSAAPIMIMAGGTGGHVFPALAVADELRAGGHRVVWLGTQRGLEARIVPQAGIDIEWIAIAGVRGRGVAAWLAAPFRIAVAIGQALEVLRRRRPSVVLGMGGFVAGPGGVAAWLTRRPLVIHEQNAVAGTTNRWLARFATRVFEAFPDSFRPRRGTELIGNPVRRAIAALPAPAERFAARGSAPLRLLVLGGSQGARVLNQTVPPALARLAASRRPEVRHQAGVGREEAVAAYASAGVAARIDTFIDDMAEAYGWADLVVARAGALTVAELEAAGVGAVLVPFPHAIDDHQTANARHFVATGAGMLMPQSELDPGRLAGELDRLLGDRAELAKLAANARRAARPGAAATLASVCVQLAEGRA
jgi:UDP-N-acetylglucosamine--N-acetylmuramyl-(pentapeptide) pyrophosphoryl-undecaprenol N-acetylglucosamine transferase